MRKLVELLVVGAAVLVADYLEALDILIAVLLFFILLTLAEIRELIGG